MKNLNELRSAISDYLSKVDGSKFSIEKDFENDLVNHLKKDFDVETQLSTQKLDESRQKLFSAEGTKVPDLVVRVQEGFVPIELKYERNPAVYELDEDKLNMYINNFSDVTVAWAIFLDKTQHNDYYTNDWVDIKNSKFHYLWRKNKTRLANACCDLKLEEVWNKRKGIDNTPKPQGKRLGLILMLSLLLSGIGQIWADTKRIYFDVSNLSSWWTNDGYTAYIHIGNGTGTTTWPGAEMTSAGSNVYYYDINTNVTQIVFCRAKNGSYDNSNQTHDINPSNNNYFKIKSSKENNKYYADYSTTTVAGGYVYFDAYASSWGTPSDVQLFVGHSSYSAKTNMTNIGNTKLWYTSAPFWPDATEFAFTSGCSSWDGAAQSYYDRIGSSTYKSAKVTSYNLNAGYAYMFKVASTANKAAVNSTSPYGYKGTAYSSLNDVTLTIKEKYSSDGVESYEEVTSGTAHGTISASGYVFDSWTTCAGTATGASITKETSTYSSSSTFGHASTVTLTAEATKAGKAFVGWYRSNGTEITTSTSTTITVSANETVYAYYKDEETHDVTVSYKCGAMTIANSTTESAVGVTTTRSVSAPAIADHTFSSWSAGTHVKTNSSTSASPISINSKTCSSSCDFTLTANYALVPCSLCVGSTSTFDAPGTKYLMSYDADADAYYYDMASSPANLYFRFYHGSSPKYYSATWNGSYPNVNSVTANGSKLSSCNVDMSGWEHLSSIHFSGLTGSAIRIWYDRQNAQVWITETKYTVSTANDGHGTVSPASVQAGKNTLSGDITAYAATGYTFNNWTVTSGGANITLTSATANPTTVKATSAGTVRANFKHRYVLRGSKNGDDSTLGGMAGWSADDNSSYSTATISDGVMTITANLTLAKTKYKMKIRDIEGSGAYYSKNSQDWTSNSNANLNTSDGSDITFTTTAPGTYTFTFNCSSKNLALAYPSVYTVTYGYGTGGSGVTATVSGNSIGASPGYAESGADVVLSYTKLAGYDFKEWNTASNGSGTKLGTGDTYTISSISANKTVYAIFTPQTYTNVTLDKNGGSTDGKYSVTYKGTSISVTTTPAKTGYHVDGYYKQAGLTNLIATSAGALQANTDYTNGSSQWTRTTGQTLYTKWAANTYTAENNIDGNGGSAGKYTATYDATSIAINTAPTRTGYNLTGYHAWGRGANTLANSSGTLTASQTEARDKDAKTLTDASKHWIYDGTDAVIYADWSPKTYSISLDQEGGASGSTSVTMTYDASTHTAITNPSKIGYTFAGYWTGDDGTGSMVIAEDGTLQANVSTYTGEGGIWKKDATCTLYAKWTANNYTVTLSASGETGYGSSPSGVKESVSATFDALMPAMGTAPTPAPGYKFMGYFLGQNGTGAQYYDASGASVINWNRAEATTLYAYFRKTEISSLEHPATVAKGDVVTVDVNPVFNQTGAQNYMDICWKLLYDNGNVVESGVAIESYTEGGTKQNQVRFTLSSLSSGYYKIQAVLRANATSFVACEAGTKLDSVTSDLRIAGNSKVTIQYQDASGNTLRENATVEVARGDSIGVKAPSIIGYAFDEWVLGDVISNSCKDEGTCDEELDSINIKAAYDGYLTAKYRKKNMVYFNNTLDWEDVYVYFYNDAKDIEGNEHEYWADNFGSGANKEQVFGGNKPYWEMEHGHMTQIEGTNIWYFDYEAAGYTTRTKVSFANVEQSIDKSGASNDEAYFHNASVVYRTDFDLAHLPMFVPINSVVNDYTTNTGSKYYRGYWMNYPESTGYVLKIFDNTGDGASLVKERNFEFSADKAMPMSITVDLEGGNKTYGFKIYRADGTWYRNDNGGTMTNGHSGDVGQAAWLFDDSGGTNCGLTTTSAGNYTFTLSFNSSGNYQVGVHYPESTGDFRVMYIDDDRITKHDSNEGKSWLLSSVIPADTEHDTISYFVRAENSKNPKYKIQKCTISDEEEEDQRTVSWADQGDEIEVPDSITKNGVYNFIFAKNDGNLELQKIEPYEGNFYIRVDGAGSSNWDNFRAADHLMPYSDYSFSQTTDPYSHYYMKYYETKPKGGGDTPKNIKFVVANDYSVCVSDTIIKDGVADDYVDANGWLSGRNANIRFMYNYKTNVATRRYLDDAQGDNSTNFLNLLAQTKDGIYLVAEYGEAQTNIQFADKGDWIYEKTVYAVPGARYKLRAQFGVSPGTVITQWFKGGAGETAADSATLIGGSGSRLPIRLIYDFKTNRIVTAYQPLSGTIDGNLEINADIMFMREHQGDIQQITFAPDKSISKIENIYCGLRFNKWTLNNKSKAEGHATLSPLLSRYERDIFYVSFPYDVRLSDVIGFGTYGQHWIVEYYDGAARAKNGFWMDSESYWKFVTPAMKDTFTMRAGTGYIVALDLDELYYIDGSHHADIWNNTETNDVELLFPGKVSSISNVDVTYNMPEHTCTINRGTTAGNRTKKDSHWNVLGVPTFKNVTGEASGATDDGGGNAEGAIRFANVAWIQELDNDLRFIYDGNLADNSLTPKAVKDFEFKAMHAYVVQYCGDVTFTTSATPAPASVAARTYAEEPIDVDFRLELNKDGVVEDQTFVSLSNDENASADFRFGEDMSKEFNSNRANIYTFIGTEWVAGNTLPMTNQTTIVPVGVKIAADGEYTFSIPEGTYGVGITLIDNEAGARVNLGLMDYTVTLAAGQIDDRFVLEISPISQISTDVEAVTDDGLQVTGARKIMIDGLLYIVKDGVVYDAQGRRL